MKHEYLMKVGCPECGCPIVKTAGYCCSDQADLWCENCGLHKVIASDQLWDWMYSVPHASFLFGIHWSKYVKLETPRPEDGHMSLRMREHELTNLPAEEENELMVLTKQYGYAIGGPQIGFVGREQKIFPAIEMY